MIVAPNLDTPVEIEISEEFKNNKSNFDKNAEKWTKDFAS